MPDLAQVWQPSMGRSRFPCLVADKPGCHVSTGLGQGLAAINGPEPLLVSVGTKPGGHVCNSYIWPHRGTLVSRRLAR